MLNKSNKAGERTPRPWSYKNILKIRSDDEPDLHADHLNDEANARLIAAAPELLEACKEIIEGMIDGPNKTQKNVTAYAVNMVREAIKKAEGK